MKNKTRLSKTWQNNFQGIQKEVKKQPKMSEDEVAKSLNIPPRDEVKYPMPNQKAITTASALIYKINLMGAQTDLNLGALLGQLYIDIFNHVNAEVQDPNAILSTLDNLREYIRTCNNPIFDMNVIPGENANGDISGDENQTMVMDNLKEMD